MATVEKSTPEISSSGAAEAPAARRFRFNVDQYYQIAEAGILTRGGRVELIDGEILVMSPFGSRHAACVDRIDRLLQKGVGERAIVRVQGPFRLGNFTEPEPDLLVLKPRPDFYASAHPGPADVLSLFEVGNTSADRDRGEKLGLYARAGVTEVWLVDLSRDVIEVYRRPTEGAYAEKSELGRGGSLAPEALPDVVLGVNAILG